VGPIRELFTVCSNDFLFLLDEPLSDELSFRTSISPTGEAGRFSDMMKPMNAKIPWVKSMSYLPRDVQFISLQRLDGWWELAKAGLSV
jgi:hypothetical protein